MQDPSVSTSTSTSMVSSCLRIGFGCSPKNQDVDWTGCQRALVQPWDRPNRMLQLRTNRVIDDKKKNFFFYVKSACIRLPSRDYPRSGRCLWVCLSLSHFHGVPRTYNLSSEFSLVKLPTTVYD